jgi:hypothetical protein
VTTKRAHKPKTADPFRNACTACGALVNEPCNTVGKNSIPLVSRSSRLVHATRLQEGTINA